MHLFATTTAEQTSELGTLAVLKERLDPWVASMSLAQIAQGE